MRKPWAAAVHGQSRLGEKLWVEVSKFLVLSSSGDGVMPELVRVEAGGLCISSHTQRADDQLYGSLSKSLWSFCKLVISAFGIHALF